MRVRTPAAGLEVSDQVLRLVTFERGAWQMNAVRLAPGVIARGRIIDRAAFVTALVALRVKVGRKGTAKKMNVVLCPSSVEAYTQLFSLPFVQGEDLLGAVELNLQMASPLPPGEAYYGWQFVERDKDKPQFQVLSAFMERKVVDEMVDALFEAGLVVMAVESRALALARMLHKKGAGIDASKSYVFVGIDNAGIEFLIIRNGVLYFEYADRWGDLMDEKGEIALAKFETTLAASVRQVVNFYGQHWTEPLGAIILSAVAFEAQAEQVIAKSTPVPVVRLTLIMGQPISSEWLTALGSNLRGSDLESKDREINLLGADSEDRFHEEQFTNFIHFWRTALPVVLAFLVLTFVAVDVFLANTKQGIESNSGSNLGSEASSEIVTLQATAGDFNHEVTLITAAESATSTKGVFLKKVVGFAAATHVAISHLSLQSFAVPITLSGTAAAEDAVLAFKTALENDAAFIDINLPLTGIQTGHGSVSFSVTFLYAR